MDSFANNLSFKEIKTQIEDIKATYKGIGNTEGIKRINTFMQQLYPSVLANNDAFKSLINTTNESFGEGFATNLQNILLGIKEPISDTEILKNKLKEVEKQLRACGETAKANKIKEYMQETQKKTIDVDSSINELRTDIEKCFGAKAVEEFNQKLNETNKKVKNVSKSNNFGSNLKTALGIGTVALGIRKTVGFLKDATTESVDFVETQNLFNVSMGKTVDQYGKLDDEASKYYTKAITFQEKLSDKLGINIEESMNYQALFNAMSKSMGIASDKAYLLSENFTKLGYDLSSLYNIDPENAMQKLRAGLSGQTKPLRDLGLDITQQSLEPLLDELGIERSVKQLSQAEKMIARYIVVLRQASLAHGDFAETMDSPANQLRIFNAQLVAFKRNMGNLWQGLLGGILPYINAIMMVINELLKMVAKLFGFNIETQNISASVGVDDLADDLGTATGKAKELKKQLMGFDEINNITLPNKTSSGSGASVGGIDQRLLDAMKEYDNLMDKVKSKANDIRDKMMEWLGFERDDNGTWKLKDGYTNIEKIRDIAIIVGGLLAGWKIANLISGLGDALKDVKTLKALGVISLSLGVKFQSDALNEFVDGKVDAESITHALLGAIGLGFGTAVLTGGGITVGLPIAITALLTAGMAWVESKLKIDEKAWKPLYDALGLEYTNKFSLANYKIRVSVGLDLIQILWNKLKGSISDIASKIKEDILMTLSNAIRGLAEVFGTIPVLGDKVKATLIGVSNEIKNTADEEKKTREELQLKRDEELQKFIQSENLKNSIASENTEKISQSLNKLSEMYVKTGEETEQTLAEQVIGQVDFANKVKEIYEQSGKEINDETRKKLDERTKMLADKLLEQTNKVKILTPDQIDAWKKLAEGSESIYNEKISQVDEDTRLALETILGKVDINSPDYINKWTKMASESSEKYNQILSMLPDDTRGKILASTIAVTGMTESTKTAYENLSEEGKDAFNSAMSSMDTDAKNKVQNAIDEINGKIWEAGRAGDNVGSSANRNFNSGLGDTTSSGTNFLQGFANVLSLGNPLNIFGKISNLTYKIVTKWKEGLGEHSPSVLTKQSAIFFAQGFTDQMAKSSIGMLKQIKGIATEMTDEFGNNLGISNIANGITINPNDFKIDTNQFIDYGQISGAIATQSNVNVSSDIEGRIENAIYSAFSNVKIPVEVEATTDEGVIFKKVQVKAREFTMQTGEPAFDY